MKKEFEKAEVEVIQFDEKEDVVTASTQIIGPVTGQGGTSVDLP